VVHEEVKSGALAVSNERDLLEQLVGDDRRCQGVVNHVTSEELSGYYQRKANTLMQRLDEKFSLSNPLPFPDAGFLESGDERFKAAEAEDERRCG
jgi:hypothetical protein